MNEEGALSDAVGWNAVCYLLLAFLGGRTWLQEGLYGLSAVCATHSLLAFCLSWLATQRRPFYGRHREALTALACTQVVVVAHLLAMYGGTNLFGEGTHRGSPPLLLFSTLVCNGGMWLVLYNIYFARLDMRYNRVAIPLLCMLPLALTSRLCNRMLEAPGSLRPLGEMFRSLEIAHSAAVFPQVLLPSLRGEPTDARQQCAIVSSWSMLLFSLVIPMLTLQRLERRQRKVLAARQRMRRMQAAAAGPSSGSSREGSPWREEEAAQEGEGETEDDALAGWQPSPGFAIEVYLSSCFVWALVSLLQPYLMP